MFWKVQPVVALLQLLLLHQFVDQRAPQGIRDGRCTDASQAPPIDPRLVGVLSMERAQRVQRALTQASPMRLQDYCAATRWTDDQRLRRQCHMFRCQTA